MGGVLSPEVLLSSAEEIFDFGVPEVQVLRLDQASAERYKCVFDNTQKFCATISGPSIDNDPLKQKPLYAVRVRRNL